jgi:hypothetical protein
VVNESDEPALDERPQRPTTSLLGDYQVPAWRYFEIRQTKNFALQMDARVVLFDGCDLSNFD